MNDDCDIKMTPIHLSVDIVNIKGQQVNLAAPITLMGHLKSFELLSQCNDVIAGDIEQSLLQIGVDEAGRGPLLGCVTVAAAILPTAWSGLIEEEPLHNSPLSILTDSKKLSEKKRDILYPLVKQNCIGYAIAEVPAAVIDQINILQATMLGMRLCTESLLTVIAKGLDDNDNSLDSSHGHPKPWRAQVLFDGNRCPDIDFESLANYGFTEADIDCQAWVKGDARHTSIAAASILAKVSRDQTMQALHLQYPHYGIVQHKGYPTAAHLQAIQQYGVLAEHRRSFSPIKKALDLNTQ